MLAGCYAKMASYVRGRRGRLESIWEKEDAVSRKL